MKGSGINWTKSTFNAWSGCTKVDLECKNCYAAVLIDERYGANREKRWGPEAKRIRTSEANWKQVRKWNRDAAQNNETHFVFVGSLMDVCDDHESIPAKWREDLFNLIDECRNLTFLLLSKRPDNYESMLAGRQLKWPHVWLGTTAGHSGAKALDRIKALQATAIHPSAQRFISAEPLLGDGLGESVDLSGIGWVIVGGESGGNGRAFSYKAAWNLYRECRRQNVKFWFKQVGEVSGDDSALRIISEIHDLSNVPDEYSEMIVRERPAPYRVGFSALALEFPNFGSGEAA